MHHISTFPSQVTDNALYVPPSGHVISTENPSYISAGFAAALPKKNNIDEEKGKSIDPKSGKLFSVSLDDHDYDNPDDLKGAKGHAINGHALKNNTTKDHATKGHDNEEKERVNIPRDERRSRYEENPVKLFSKKRKEPEDSKNNDDFANAMGNPLYDVKPLGLPGHPANHVYDNVKKNDHTENPHSEDIGQNSIVNPLYDLPDPATGESDQEPVYEEVSEPKFSPSSKKTKSKFKRSLSSEKAAGYEELDHAQHSYELDDDDDDDAFGDTDA